MNADDVGDAGDTAVTLSMSDEMSRLIVERCETMRDFAKLCLIEGCITESADRRLRTRLRLCTNEMMNKYTALVDRRRNVIRHMQTQTHTADNVDDDALPDHVKMWRFQDLTRRWLSKWYDLFWDALGLDIDEANEAAATTLRICTLFEEYHPYFVIFRADCNNMLFYTPKEYDTYHSNDVKPRNEDRFTVSKTIILCNYITVLMRYICVSEDDVIVRIDNSSESEVGGPNIFHCAKRLPGVGRSETIERRVLVPFISHTLKLLVRLLAQASDRLVEENKKASGKADASANHGDGADDGDGDGEPFDALTIAFKFMFMSQQLSTSRQNAIGQIFETLLTNGRYVAIEQVVQQVIGELVASDDDQKGCLKQIGNSILAKLPLIDEEDASIRMLRICRQCSRLATKS